MWIVGLLIGMLLVYCFVINGINCKPSSHKQYVKCLGDGDASGKCD